jgi:transcriptional regulator GlxA family with amidase domain
VRLAVLTFDGFNEIDSFVSSHILNRVDVPGWKAEITCPTPSVVSRNGVRLDAQQPLEFASDADVVLFGSGSRTAEIARDAAVMSRIRLDPARQLVGSQCSGAMMLVRLGLAGSGPVCTDNMTRPVLEAAGVEVLDRTFFVSGNVASAGGCLSSPCLATWVIWRLLGRAAAEAALDYVAPVGERERFIADTVAMVAPYMADAPAGVSSTLSPASSTATALP